MVDSSRLCGIILLSIQSQWRGEFKGGELKNRPPKATEIKACSKWLDSELTLIQPTVILCLGAPSAKTLIHPRFRITEERGVWFTDTLYAVVAD